MSMPRLVPGHLFLTKGVGTHKEDKNARDAASRQAGLEDLNLVSTSSVLPPDVVEVDRRTFAGSTTPGEIVFAIHGVCQSNVPGQRVCAGLALARSRGLTGFVAELYEEPGVEEREMKKRVETMALQIFADERGVEDFAAGDVWQDGTSGYDVGGDRVTVTSLVASGVCNHDGDYTCALVAAVLLP